MNALVVNFTLLVAIFILHLLSPKKNSSVNNYVTICFILLVFTRTFVDIRSVPDLVFYCTGYRQLVNIPFSKVAFANLYDVKIPEIGFRYLMKICGIISSSFTFFLLIYGLLWTTGYIKTIKRYSPYVVLSILFVAIEAYNQSLFVIRQHLAMVIVFLSYRNIIEKNLNKYLLMMLLAFSLHQTAIIAIPLYFLYQIRGKKKLLLSMFAIGGIVFLTFSYILSKLGGVMLIGYSSYIDSDAGTNATGAILTGIVLLSYILALKSHIFEDGINRLLFISLLLGFILSFCGIGFNPTSRLVMYYTSISFLAVPRIISNIRSNNIKLLTGLFFIMLYSYMTFCGSGFESLKEFKLKI